MGDLLQTTPLLSGLRNKYPGAGITLLANQAFAGICSSIPLFDELITFDMRGYRSRLLDSTHSLVDNYRFLEKMLDDVNRKEYDLLFNVTHSQISAFLSSMIKAGEIRGFTSNSEGHRVIKHPWMRYFFNVIPNRNYNPFHLVDMYLKVGEVEPHMDGLYYEMSEDDAGTAEALLRQEGIAQDEALVGIHLGASKGDKRWPVSSYASLAEMIKDYSGAGIVLFGSKDEEELATEFKRCTKVDHTSFVGRTNIRELAALLKRCRLFISNDTGPLHIATAVGTKVVDISAANVNFMETGPYGDGHYVVQADLPCVPCAFNVECKDMVCKSVITPQAVFEVYKYSVGDNQVDFNPDAEIWKDLQVYRSCFKEDGYLGFNPLVNRRLNKETVYRMLYRDVWNLNSKEPEDISEIADRICNEISSYYNLDCNEEMMSALVNEFEIIKKLYRLSGEGLYLCKIIEKEAGREKLDVNKIKGTWDRIEAIEKEIEISGNTNPCFGPFISIFKFAKEALEDNELKQLASASCRIYEDLKNNISNMMQLMKRVIPYIKSKSKERVLC